MGATVPKGIESKVFTPLTIGNGTLTLSHRVVLAPLTRNRGVPLNPNPTPENSNRIWYPDSLMTTYYLQRTTPGGLLITEGLAPSLESNGMPGCPGLFGSPKEGIPKQIKGWKDIVDAVHAKGGFIYAQLWHAGRASIPHHTGIPTVSASATPYEGDEEYSHPAPFTTEPIKYRDFPPTELSIEGIKRTIEDYTQSAKIAVEQCGFDGIELHAGNGYLPEQFLSSNINTRTDEYGGTPEKRCKFTLDLMNSLAAAIGQDKLAIRLTPFGLFNQTRGEQRLETWGNLCRELKKNLELSYVHFIEPRYEQVHSVEEKDKFLSSWGLETIDLKWARDIFGDTPMFSAGGWNDTNVWGVLEKGDYDGFAFGRYFLSTPDFVERLKKGLPFNPYNRVRFYGPQEEREVGFTDYPTWEESQVKKKIDGSA